MAALPEELCNCCSSYLGFRTQCFLFETGGFMHLAAGLRRIFGAESPAPQFPAWSCFMLQNKNAAIRVTWGHVCIAVPTYEYRIG
eukprot:scaffold152126_cov17-Tisochrysis_lutea.AAC.1